MATAVLTSTGQLLIPEKGTLVTGDDEFETLKGQAGFKVKYIFEKGFLPAFEQLK